MEEKFIQIKEAHGRLVKALIKAQNEMNDPLKTAYNPGFKSKFADLGAHLEAVRKPLRDNGLTVVQTMNQFADTGKHVLVTTLYHVDGGSLSSSMALELSQNTMQGLGSALTYSRRYAIAAMFALYGDVDDDGNTASEKGGTPAQAAQSPQEVLFTQAKTRLKEAKSEAEKQKVLALCKSLPQKQRDELASLANVAKPDGGK